MNATTSSAPAPRLLARVAALWPALADRLGARQGAFLDAAAAQAARRGLEGADAERYVNLCCAFGPAFEERPENEWALAVLIDDRLGGSVKVHQLLRRGLDTLRRRGADTQPLADADAALLDLLDAERRAVDADAEPLPRSACDIDAVEVRVTDVDWRREYRFHEGAWQLLPGPAAPPTVRIDAARPAPEVLTVLTHAPGDGPAARLQLRQVAHGGCAGERHPAVRWLGAHGLSSWRGAAARAVGWPVNALRQPLPATGLGAALAEETAPDVDLLELPTCGVRDDGVPFGPLRTQVWAYPAHQWLYVLQRDAVAPLTWPRGDAMAIEPLARSRCRIERDGAAIDAGRWLRGFDRDLPQALAAGLDRLFAAWQQTASNAALRVGGGLLTGRAVLTWGWREAPAGMAAPPLLRVLADLDLGCAVDLALDGEVESGGARSRVRLVARGEARLVLAAAREAPQPGVADTLLPAVMKLRIPFEVEHDPLATADGVVCARLGPCSGALVGEAGLRPRLSGGSGWQWYVRLGVEPVLAPTMLHDPLLGQTHRTLALLPAVALLDWSLG